MGRIARYNTDALGKFIRKERIKQGITQRELALELDVEPSMVTQMERNNRGLNSVQTRRELARVLGISPLALGVGTLADTKIPQVYNTNILKTTLNLHREAYFTTGNFGIPVINSMVSEIEEILTEKNNPKDILEVYAEYNILGVAIGYQEMNPIATSRYIGESLSAARSLNTPITLAHALSTASYATYGFGDLPQAEKYALEAFQITKIPNHLKGTIYVDLGRITGDMQQITKGQTLAERDNDFPAFKLTADWCLLSKAFVLIDSGKYGDALQVLTTAERLVSANLVRRRCIIQVLQAKSLLALEEYEQAVLVAETALTIARDTKSKPNIERLRGVVETLKKSPVAASDDVIRLSNTLKKILNNNQ